MAEKRTRQSSRAGRPWDLVVVVLATLIAAAMVLVPSFSGSPIQVVLVLPFLLFLPGYALVSAVYVERAATGETVGEQVVPRPEHGLDSPARVVLSMLASVAMVSTTALVLNFTPFGIRRVPVLVALTILTLLFSILAVQRRSSVPRRERFTPSVPAFGAGGWSIRGDSALSTAVNLVVVVSLFLALATTAYALAAPPSAQGQTFTEFYLLSENESGELVANDYPSDLTAGEPVELTAAVENHEGQSQAYTVIVQQQRVENGRVVESEELRRESQTLAAGQSWQYGHRITPTMEGENVRLTYLLYRGDAPRDATVENAYRNLRLYVDVSAGDA